MDIKSLIIGNTYSRKQLREIFGGSFYGGMNICKKTNSLVLICKHYGTLKYKDQWKSSILHYTGMGQVGDQTMSSGNKALNEATKTGISVYLFEDFSKAEHKYYGKVFLVNDPYQEHELDVNGSDRLVWKFPLKLLSDSTSPVMSKLSDEDMSIINGAGIIKPSYSVVCAVIIQNNQLLCAQRGYGSLKGYWEFPGGKIEAGETPEQALIREIKEELDITISVEEHLDDSHYEYSDAIIDLKAFRCTIVSGKINDKEHAMLKWAKRDEISSLNWAQADLPIVEVAVELLPVKIDGDPIKFDYFESKPVSEKKSDTKRTNIDFEKAEKAKIKSGKRAEEAVKQYEIDRLLENGHPDLAAKVIRTSEISNDYGYDVLSYEIVEKKILEKHIEIKNAKHTENFLTFFISANELDHFKNDPLYRIYCLFQNGKDYKLHEVNKTEFRSDYLTAISYQVTIRISSY